MVVDEEGDASSALAALQSEPDIAAAQGDAAREAPWPAFVRDLSVIVPPFTLIGAARRGKVSLIRNLASHGVGRALHEAPTEIATWPDRREKRILREGQVITVEPFLSLGGLWAD